VSISVKNFRRANVAEIRVKIESHTKKKVSIPIYVTLSEEAVNMLVTYTSTQRPSIQIPLR